ncbi:polysaccharide deacetylase family protein [Microbacterium sp.]|uniref:polysaccharide deacetylase family protein n=1 Tax=Microbacterium sp. TaxID=51671 RepID=UPI003C75F168
MLVISALAVSSCAAPRDETWIPVQWPSAGRVLSERPSASDNGAAVATFDLRLRDDDVGIDARWARLPGDQPINALVEQTVREAVSVRSAVAGVGYRPQVFVAGAGLGDRGCTSGAASDSAQDVLGGRVGSVVVCEIALARGTIFGETLRTVTGDGAGIVSDESTTFYTDLSNGATGTSVDLVADASALWVQVIDALRRHLGSLSLSPLAPPTGEQLAVFVPSLAGLGIVYDELIVPVPAELHADALDGFSQWSSGGARPFGVALPLTAVRTALTALGQAVAAASGDFTGPALRGTGFEPVPCDLVACMALTLDDGPSTLTPEFLDILRDQQSAATFFMLGKNASRYPDTVARVAAEGHEIGNHTWDHPYLTDISDAQVTTQLGDTRALLQRLSGQSIPFFRPPGGYVDDHVVALAGEPAILWSVDTRDWAGPGDDDLASYAIDTPQRGSIMLMHDIQPGAARVFDRVVAGLRDRGLTLVTVDALFDGAVPGGIVHHGPAG